MQTADCRLQIGYKMQTANWVQNTDWEFILFLAHSCWKQWVRYCSEADVDGSCISWTEVVFRGRKLYSVGGSCIPWTEVVDHLVKIQKVKMNFDEAQKLTWKEMKFVWFNKNNNLKSLPELLKMQVESRSRNVHFNTRCDHAEGYQREPYC